MINWYPSATINTLKFRAELIARIRAFFKARRVWEVETPILLSAVDTNPYVEPLSVEYRGEIHYLQTSPEFAMKRLLAAGSGSIFQLCKSFRTEELGRYHNPEFTLLEWYRVGFDHLALMREVDEFLQYILQTEPAETFSYRDIFLQYLHIDPLTISTSDLHEIAEAELGRIGGVSLKDKANRDVWLQLLFGEKIEPCLGQKRPAFIYDYPASQASLARIRKDDPPVAERFEVYFKGIELANGFHELADLVEQRSRFEIELQQRQENGCSTLKIDERFLAALEEMPDCAGVALGIDRLMMLALRKKQIKEILSFGFENI
jgi:lysyl-tRNA synthetase class 2